MSVPKRQQIYSNVNPIYKIYGGEEASYFIPKKKRKQITSYMTRVSVFPKSTGNHPYIYR